MSFLGMLFGPIMRFAYTLTKNYGAAIIVFTVITKILLMPLSVWLQKNSIKMVFHSQLLRTNIDMRQSTLMNSWI